MVLTNRSTIWAIVVAVLFGVVALVAVAALAGWIQLGLPATVPTPTYLMESSALAATPTPTFTPVPPTTVLPTVAFTFTPTPTSTFTPTPTKVATKANTATVEFTPTPTKVATTVTTVMSDTLRPALWLATNGQKCEWGVPLGTILSGENASYVFTNCTSFNLKPGKTVSFDWTYSRADYEFLLEGEAGAEGIAWWGPMSGSTVSVRYNDGPVCIGRSFEVLPDVRITGVFTNAAGVTNATWSQGDWGVSLNKLYPPECRPGKVTTVTVSAQPTPNSAVVPTPKPASQPTASVVPVAPAAESAMRKLTQATYGPISFKSAEQFGVQHMGNWVFHVRGWTIDMVAKDFVCTWVDWTTSVKAPPWNGDYKITCMWSPTK